VKPLQSWSKFCVSSLKRSDCLGSGGQKINKQGIELHLDHRKIDPSAEDTHNVEKREVRENEATKSMYEEGWKSPPLRLSRYLRWIPVIVNKGPSKFCFISHNCLFQ
jgi:hypothetical protein